MNPELAFIFIWAGFLVLGCMAAVLFFLWGMRSGQFGDQERAGYLPLDAGIPEGSKTFDPTENV